MSKVKSKGKSEADRRDAAGVRIRVEAKRLIKEIKAGRENAALAVAEALRPMLADAWRRLNLNVAIARWFHHLTRDSVSSEVRRRVDALHLLAHVVDCIIKYGGFWKNGYGGRKLIADFKADELCLSGWAVAVEKWESECAACYFEAWRGGPLTLDRVKAAAEAIGGQGGPVGRPRKYTLKYPNRAYDIYDTVLTMAQKLVAEGTKDNLIAAFNQIDADLDLDRGDADLIYQAEMRNRRNNSPR